MTIIYRLAFSLKLILRPTIVATAFHHWGDDKQLIGQDLLFFFKYLSFLPNGLGYCFSRSGSRGCIEKFLSIMYSPFVFEEVNFENPRCDKIELTHVIPQGRLFHSTGPHIGCRHLGGVVVEEGVVLKRQCFN